MSVRRHISYGSTSHFRDFRRAIHNDIKYLRNKDLFKLLRDEDREPTTEELEAINAPVSLPQVTLTGSEKIHGSFCSVCYSQGEIWIQSRNSIKTVLGDMNGLAQFVKSIEKEVLDLVFKLVEEYNLDLTTHTLALDGEWAGSNIQGKNAACSGVPNSIYLFEHFRVVSNEDNTSELLPTEPLKDLVAETDRVYLVKEFGEYTITLDLSEDNEVNLQKLKELAESIEDNSPVAKYFNKPDNIGEGAVLFTTYNGITYKVKTKADKHAGKAKAPREKLSDEVLEARSKLAEEVTPAWRIAQGISELGITESKEVGLLIKWVLTDIVKEETLTIEEAGLTLRDINSNVAKTVKDYYFNSL